MLLEPIPLKKRITGVDVTFSNSLIEDYSNRPHWTLWGLTPNQVHAGTVFDKEAYRERIRSSSIERRRISHRSCLPRVRYS